MQAGLAVRCGETGCLLEGLISQSEAVWILKNE